MNKRKIFGASLRCIGVAFAVSMSAWPLRAAQSAKQSQAAPPTAPVPVMAVTDIKVSFKLDPRLSGGSYGGERWVSSPLYMGASGQDTVSARGVATGAKAQALGLSPDWVSADMSIVAISPVHGNAVEIKVLRAGQSKLTVSAGGIAKEILVSATMQGKVLQLQISQ